MAAALLGGEPPPAPPKDDGDELPEDEAEKLRVMLAACEKALHTAIVGGKARNATDLASTRKKLADQLHAVEADRAREAENTSEETARAEVLAFVRSLAPEDPLRADLLQVLHTTASSDSGSSTTAPASPPG